MIHIGLYGDLERENNNKTIQELSVIEEEAILGEPSLGKRLLCKYSWYR